MLKLLLAALTLTSCSADHRTTNRSGDSTDWYRIGLTRLGATYADRADTVRKGDEIQVTNYTFWFPAAETEMERTEERQWVRCRDRTLRNVRLTFVYPGGRRDPQPASPERRSLPPGTNGANMILFHCGDTGRGFRLGDVRPDEDFRSLRR